MTTPDKLMSFEGRYLDDHAAQELLLIAQDTMHENERLHGILDALKDRIFSSYPQKKTLRRIFDEIDKQHKESEMSNKLTFEEWFDNTFKKDFIFRKPAYLWAKSGWEAAEQNQHKKSDVSPEIISLGNTVTLDESMIKDTPPMEAIEMPEWPHHPPTT